jgi:hypothetical protein
MPDHGAIAADLAQPTVPTTPERRSPAKWIKVLLPVWGEEFTQQFLEFSLPTLLAPGNLPALAKTLPTEFIFLTGRRDEAVIRASAGYLRLAATCDVSFYAIDDLITEGNHSTTVTLAFAAAVRRTGTEMLDTCFFFLVADYIVANGSLAAAIKPILAGASAVQTGNFQIAIEDAIPWLDRELEGNGGTLVLPPRRLMRHALTRIHPATVANIVNSPLSHNSHANRLFWRVDADTLIGHFYLLHMLCIRPEVVDFVIGASCDYSFIPEMCPSGNIAVMSDSDDYLVIEAQPRDHEANLLRPGPARPKLLAASLSEWTTARHRDNARHTLIFHAADLPPALSSVSKEADAFVAQVGSLLKRKPMPHRDHPYWRGALAAHHSQRGRRPDAANWQLTLGRPASRSARVTGWLGNLLLGRAPNVRRWHPRWADYQLPRRVLERITDDPESRLLIVSGRPTAMTNWLAYSSSRAQRIPLSRLLRFELDHGDDLRDRFTACYLEITDREIDRLELVIDQIIAALTPSAEILLASFNDHWLSGAEAYGDKITNAGLQIVRRLDLSLAEVRLVACRRWRWAANAKLLQLGQGIFRRSPILVPAQAALIFVQSLIAFGSNLASRSDTFGASATGQIVSSLFMRLRVARGAAGEEAPPIKDAVSCSGREATDRPAATREPQYQHLLEVEREVGLASLGLMTNQVWHEDPRRLSFILARYKFVAKMLSGCRAVAEVGCGDAFGTRIVQQEVDKVAVYDFDPVFIRDIRVRQAGKWPLAAEVHDILAGPLPHLYDAVYSLDVIEHIPPENEDVFIANLRASLTEHGVLIIGTPSLESQAYASPQSKAGHVNCKSARALKLLLNRYFHTVFLFSMNDEVVHTGFSAMAHYLLALCSDRR